jgi:K+-transporting ATPase ATPase C chain
MFTKHLRISIALLIVFTVLTGILYPLLVTGLAQILFPGKANGSLLTRGNRLLGSELIGQPFSDPGYFWGRPSATGPYPYNGGLSAGSNYGPMNSAYLATVQERVRMLRRADPENREQIPVDLVTSSGSGLDPDISIAAAFFQAGRVARTRGMTVEQVRAYVERFSEERTLGFLGEPRVHVLSLNLALDGIRPDSETTR